MTNTFDASEQVDDLAYDFTKWAGPGASGEIPEPNAKQIAKFFSTIAQMIRDEQDGPKLDPENPADLLRALDSLDEAKFVKMSKAMCDAYGALCSGTPSAAMIAKLPWRIQQAFFGWIQGQFLPTEPTAATSPSPAAGTSESSTTSPASTSA